jgi:hypothetical protein
MIGLMTGTVVKRIQRERARRGAGRVPLIILVGCIVLVCGLPIRAAEPATVTFTLDFPGSDPDHYSISVQSNGQGRYECSAKLSADSDEREAYNMDFDVSEATRVQIFELTARAHYFTGKIDSGSRKIAFTGAKKLAYKDKLREITAAYNYSPQLPVQQLTTLFQSVGATLEFGRRLAYYHRYQKLGLDDELKRMEDQARSGNLIELQAAKPVLQEIYDDSSVMNVVRARAQRIMAMGNGAAAGR